MSVEKDSSNAISVPALPAFDRCSELSAEISREGKRIYNEYALLDRAYDRTEALKIKPGGRFAQ